MAQLLSAARTQHVFGSSVQRPPAQRRVVAMAKPGLHPEWHDEAKVVCNGEEVLVTSGTQASYTVDIWSGNHPFYQGSATTMVTDEGRVNRFKRRFVGLESLATPAVLSGGPLQMEDKPKAGGKGKGKGRKK